jgi:hypothetical protein
MGIQMHTAIKHNHDLLSPNFKNDKYTQLIFKIMF